MHYHTFYIFSPSVQFKPHGLQYTRLPCSSPLTTQSHVLWVSDTIQPSLPLSSPSPPAFNHFQHQGFFKWVSSSNQGTKLLEFQLQHHSFQWMIIQDWFPLGWAGWISLLSKGRSRAFSNTTVQKHQFFFFFWCSAFFTVQLSHPYMTTGKTIALTRWTFAGNVSAF